MNKSLGNTQTSLHTTRQILCVSVTGLIETHLLQHLVNSPSALGGICHTRKRSCILQKLTNLVLGKEPEILRQITQNAAHLLALCANIIAAYVYLTLGRFHQCYQDTHQRGLSGAVRPQKSKHP